MISAKFGKDSSEKLNDSEERESCAEKSQSPNSELGPVLEVRVHEEAKLKVSHAHATS